MTKDKLLKSIAEHGYNVGFGAKKNFSSHDIIVKLPSWIGFISLAIGIIQLGYSSFGNNKELSTSLILVSVASLYISIFNSKADMFDKEGTRLTIIYNKLKDLYYLVQSQNKPDFSLEKQSLDLIMNDFYSNTISQQVFLSQWYAHFKFFYEMQIDWIDEQLKFKFFKDKVPGSLKSAVVIVILTIVIFILIANGYV